MTIQFKRDDNSPTVDSVKSPEMSNPLSYGLLSAPCVFCGYSGEGYWQNGTHSEECPWHMIGGEAERSEKTRHLVGKLFDLGIAAENYIDQTRVGTGVGSDVWEEYEEELRVVRNYR